jgi:hypothetical protein
VWRGAGAWSHAPGRCASATTRAAHQPDEPHQPDESDEPDQARKPYADEPFEPDARDSREPDTHHSNEPNAPALVVDVRRAVAIGKPGALQIIDIL